MSSFELRRAEVSERDELLNLLTACFTPEGRDEPTTGVRTHPHLFTDERIVDHIVRIEDGRMVGTVGLYPYDFRVRGVIFKAAGIGQVCCHPDYRGRGVMSSILKQLNEESTEMGLDFTWLWGDRQRYGRYGWASGGETLRFETFGRYVPAPVRANKVRRLNPKTDRRLVARAIKQMESTVDISESELGLLLQSTDTSGLVLNRSFIVTRWGGRQVCLAHGQPPELASLLANQLARLRRAAEPQWKMTIECAAGVSPILKVCVDHYWTMSVAPSAAVRAVRLVPLLEKMCAVAQPAVSGGDDRLTLENRDTGEVATIECRRGKLSVKAVKTGPSRRLVTAQLSELCFGLTGPDLLLRRLAPASPLRRVFPCRLHIPHFFAV